MINLLAAVTIAAPCVAEWRAMWSRMPVWSVDVRQNLFSGALSHVVMMNNHTVVSTHETRAEASLAAARLNYANGSYQRPVMLGLDGL